MTENLQYNSEEAVSPLVCKELKKALGEKFDLAISILTYTEVKSLEFNYIGKAELSDAFTHIKRAIYANDDTKAIEEINSASEHIRRAAVESLQRYIGSRYVEFIHRKSRLSALWYRYDKQKVNDLETQLKSQIIDGRMKGTSRDEWVKAIGYFKEADDILDQLEKEIPSINERVDWIKIFVYLLIGIITGYLLALIKL